MVNDSLLNKILLVSIGAIPAAILRWQIENIFLVNIIGCFLIGYINSTKINSRYKLIFSFGFCGSLTTFSGWIFDLFELIINGLLLKALVNLICVFILSFLFIHLGSVSSQKIAKL